MELGSSQLREILHELAPERRRRCACDCAEHVLPLFARCYPADRRPHNAIQIARAFAQGGASQAELAAAAEAAEMASMEAVGDETCVEEVAPMASETAAGCCLADIDEAVAFAVENAIWVVILAAVGVEAIDLIWEKKEHLLDAATVERYHRAEAAERSWQYQRILQYRPTET
jgi:hypothetical protein